MTRLVRDGVSTHHILGTEGFEPPKTGALPFVAGTAAEAFMLR